MKISKKVRLLFLIVVIITTLILLSSSKVRKGKAVDDDVFFRFSNKGRFLIVGDSRLVEDLLDASQMLENEEMKEFGFGYFLEDRN